jgi:hypothetical protein
MSAFDPRTSKVRHCSDGTRRANSGRMHCGKSSGAQAPGKTCPWPLPGPDQPRGAGPRLAAAVPAKIEMGREPHRHSRVARGRARGLRNAKVAGRGSSLPSRHAPARLNCCRPTTRFRSVCDRRGRGSLPRSSSTKLQWPPSPEGGGNKKADELCRAHAAMRATATLEINGRSQQWLSQSSNSVEV